MTTTLNRTAILWFLGTAAAAAVLALALKPSPRTRGEPKHAPPPPQAPGPTAVASQRSSARRTPTSPGTPDASTPDAPEEPHSDLLALDQTGDNEPVVRDALVHIRGARSALDLPTPSTEPRIERDQVENLIRDFRTIRGHQSAAFNRFVKEVRKRYEDFPDRHIIGDISTIDERLEDLFPGYPEGYISHSRKEDDGKLHVLAIKLDDDAILSSLNAAADQLVLSYARPAFADLIRYFTFESQ